MEEKYDPIAEIKGLSGEGTISGPGVEEIGKGKSKTPIVITAFAVLVVFTVVVLLL